MKQSQDEKILSKREYFKRSTLNTERLSKKDYSNTENQCDNLDKEENSRNPKGIIFS